MITYQLAVMFFFVGLILMTLIIGSVELWVKKCKAKKQAYKDLERKYKVLENELYALKFRAKLKGVDLDV